MNIKLTNCILAFTESEKSVVTPDSTQNYYFMVSSSTTYGEGHAFPKADASYTSDVYNLSTSGISVGDTIHVKGANTSTQPLLIFLNSDSMSFSDNTSTEWLAAEIALYKGTTQVGATSFYMYDDDIVVPEGTKAIVVSYRNTVDSYKGILSV